MESVFKDKDSVFRATSYWPTLLSHLIKKILPLHKSHNTPCYRRRTVIFLSLIGLTTASRKAAGLPLIGKRSIAAFPQSKYTFAFPAVHIKLILFIQMQDSWIASNEKIYMIKVSYLSINFRATCITLKSVFKINATVRSLFSISCWDNLHQNHKFTSRLHT